MIGYDLSPSMFYHVTQLSKFLAINSSATALQQRWNNDIGSAGTALLAALE